MATQSTGIFDPAPNTLDQYDNVAYHFKLFMMPQAITKGTDINIDSTNGVVIAESGTTGQMFIEDVTIKSVVGTNKKVKNTVAIDFDIQIREFSGASLIDKIYYASLDLGIQSYYKCPYFLELTFKGRDPVDGKAIDTNLGSLKWVWPVVILSIETEVDSGGAAYSIKAAPWDHIGYRQSNARLQESFSYEVDTVQTAFDRLADKFNKIANNKKISSHLIPDEYEIKVDPTFAGYTFVDPAEVNDVGTKNSDDTKEVALRKLNVDANASMQSAINSILANTKEYQKSIKGSKNAEDNEISDDVKKGKPKVMHRIFVTTVQLEYDTKRGDYAKRFIYSVKSYKTNTIFGSTNETAVSSKGRLKEIITNKFLQKRYDYIFTGLNDQIINFDMRFNFAWYAPIPAQAGLFTQHSNSAEGKTLNTKWLDFMALKEKIASYVAKIPKSGKQNNQKTELELQRYEEEITNAELVDTQTTELLDFVKQARINTGIAIASNAKQNANLVKNTNDEYKQTSANAMNPSQQYVNDYILSEGNVAQEVGTSQRIIPISFEDSTKSTEDKNVEGTKGPGRAYVSSMFEQAFRSKTGDILKIDLNIKGDPYWIGEPIVGNVLTRNATDVNPPTSNTTKYSNTDFFENYFILRVKTPEVPEVSTGIIKSRPTTIDGVYGVLEIEHSFTNGLFTQTLLAVVDPIINMTTVEEAINDLEQEQKMFDILGRL